MVRKRCTFFVVGLLAGGALSLLRRELMLSKRKSANAMDKPAAQAYKKQRPFCKTRMSFRRFFFNNRLRSLVCTQKKIWPENGIP